ncbi:MAG TPA: hypothetical protein VGW34_11800 [Allosphingosinicella sp.]|nr:hypothetical protein [Allosphingosinicella sp.]
MPPPQAPKCTCTLSDTSASDTPGLTRYTFRCRWDKGDTTPKYIISVDAASEAEAHQMAIDQCPYEPSRPGPGDR